MKKAELIQEIHDRCSDDIGSKAAATRIVEAVFDAIGERLAHGEDVNVSGFGKFFPKEQKARTARNPHDGSEIKVPAKTVAKFRPAAGLKELVNS